MESIFPLGQEILWVSAMLYLLTCSMYVPCLLQGIFLLNTSYQFSDKDYINLYRCVLFMHVPTVFSHILTRTLFLEFCFDHILKFHGIRGKLSDSLCQLFCCHLILIQKPAEFLFVQRNFLNVKFCSCKNMQNVLLVHSEKKLWETWTVCVMCNVWNVTNMLKDNNRCYFKCRWIRVKIWTLHKNKSQTKFEEM